MRVGISFLPRDLDTMVTKAKSAEKFGFDLFGIADSQCIARELYTTLGAVAYVTESIKVGPVVTNPVTRHPAVTASAIGTINEATNGRTFLGIASGDSAVYTLGERPSSLSEMETTLSNLNSLWTGDKVEYNEELVRLQWMQDASDRTPIPIYMAAEGPKTLRVAGQIADHVIIGLGILPEVIETSVELVNEGARQAGRDPDSIEKWFLTQLNIADTYQSAVDEIKMALGASAHHSLQFTMENKCVPNNYKSELQELVERYNPHEHEKTGESENKRLVEELNLTEYLADRYAIVGTTDDCVQQLQEIKKTGLVDGVIMPAHLEEKRNLLSQFGEGVLPYIRS